MSTNFQVPPRTDLDHKVSCVLWRLPHSTDKSFKDTIRTEGEETRRIWRRLAGPPFDIPDFPRGNGIKAPDYLTWVRGLVSTKRHQTFKLKQLFNPRDVMLMIGDLDDTIYRGKNYEVNEWGKFYLPDIVNMQVVGVVEGTSCLCEQLVLMTCEDKRLYAYDGEELHMVASSLEQLRDKGMEYPASRRYYNGEAFKHMTDKDWAKVKNGAVGRSLAQAHHKRVTAGKSRFLEKLKATRQYTGAIS